MEIRVAAWGWKHTQWEQGYFYPDDLPSDWRLSYYANEFDAVVIPAVYWTKAERDTDENWIDDVDEDFTFLVDWPVFEDEAERVEAIKYCVEFIEQLDAGSVVLLIDNHGWSLLSADQKQQLLQFDKKYPLLQYGFNDPIDGLKRLDVDAKSSDSGVVLIESPVDENLRELSGRLQGLITAKTQYLILAGTAPSIERLKELKTLVTLLKI